jgi:hypothetical protein
MPGADGRLSRLSLSSQAQPSIVKVFASFSKKQAFLPLTKPVPDEAKVNLRS